MNALLLSLAWLGSGHGPASAEIQALKIADQSARQFTSPPPPEVLERMSQADRAREHRIRELLREDKVVTAEDLDCAALILQHGADPDDYQLARELSILAFAKGQPSTLQTAAEDRFLLSIGRKQRFGNQFGFDKGGKLVFRELNDESLARVTDELRAEFLIAPVSLIREKGLQAFGEAIPQLVERFQRRVKADYIQDWDRRKTSRELAALARGRAGQRHDARAVARVLELYHAKALSTPANFEDAARVLMTAPDPSTILLANELAALASSRKRASARLVFARSWDRFLTIIGNPDRYGTQSGFHRVSPIVAREFGLRRRGH